jgi:integrase
MHAWDGEHGGLGVAGSNPVAPTISPATVTETQALDRLISLVAQRMGAHGGKAPKGESARQNGAKGGRPYATLGSFIDHSWWPNYTPPKASTKVTAGYIVKTLKDDLGHLSFAALDEDRVEAWWSRVRGRGHSAHHANKFLSYLRQILKKARRKKLIGIDPTGDIHKLRVEERVRALSDEVRELVFKHANDRLRLYCYVAYYIPACRRQDIHAITRRQFDLSPQPDAPHGRFIQTIQKTRREHVTPLHPRLREVLEPILLGLKPGDRVLPQYGDLKSITKAFSRLAKRLDLGDFHFHDFRHDAGCKALAVTGDIKAVQALLGHTQIATTQKYAHHLNLKAVNRAVEGL